MLEFIKTPTHYCVHKHNAGGSNMFVGTLLFYLGQWHFQARTPLGKAMAYGPTAEELETISSFIKGLS